MIIISNVMAGKSYAACESLNGKVDYSTSGVVDGTKNAL